MRPKELFVTPRPQGEGAGHAKGATWGRQQGWSGGRGRRENLDKAFVGVFMRKKG